MSSTDFSKLPASQHGDLDAVRRQLKSLYLYMGVDLVTLVPVAFVACMSGSVMLLADVLDYGKGFVSSMIAVAILKSVESGRAGRFEHGVGRLSTLGTLVMSITVNVSLFSCIGFAVYRLFHPLSIENGFTLLGAGMQVVGLGVNIWLFLRNLRLARETKSPLMAATWRMALADTLLSISILLTIGLTYAFRNWDGAVYIDPVCAIVALSLGLCSYAPLLKKVLAELSDLSLDEAHQLAVTRALAKNFDLYTGFHGVKTRYSGGVPRIIAYLSFPGDISVDEALKRVATIKASFAEEIKDSVSDVVIVPLDEPGLERPSAGPAGQE